MPLTIKEQKSALRKAVIEKRKTLDQTAVECSDMRVLQNVLELPWYQQANMIFCFVSTAGEINTKPIILDALAKGKRVCVPRCLSKGVMSAHEITGFEDLQNGKYDIPEPREHCAYVEPSQIDFVIVPCVTCNSKGHRLGYGGGFYDRFLENNPIKKAVLCRLALMCEEIPIDSNDVVIDVVITD